MAVRIALEAVRNVVVTGVTVFCKMFFQTHADTPMLEAWVPTLVPVRRKVSPIEDPIRFVIAKVRISLQCQPELCRKSLH